METKEAFKDKLQEYHDMYIDCFKDLPPEIGQMVWIHPDKMITTEKHENHFQEFVDSKEIYVRQNISLANSIQDLNGIYLPFLVGRGKPERALRTGMEQGNELFVDEGSHRLDALHQLKWGEKVLCLYHPRGFSYNPDYFPDNEPHIRKILRFLPKSFKRTIPFKVCFPDKRMTYTEIMTSVHSANFYEKVEGRQDVLVHKFTNMYDFKVRMYQFARFLSDMFVSYKLLFDEEWPAPDKINKPGYFPDVPYKEQELTEKLSEIKLVEVEFNSFCNRKCPWCPNKDIDRIKQRHDLNIESFEKVVKELHDKGFKGTFSFSRYNEPLADTELLSKYIKLIRAAFGTRVKIVFNTNGDYLKHDTLATIDVDEMTVMDYDMKGVEACRKKLVNLGYEILAIEGNYIYFHYYDVDKAFKRVGLFVCNWPKWANFVSRGNSISYKIEKKERTTPCMEPSAFLGIDFNGNVMPCCEVRSDNPKHKSMILGNVNHQTIEEIWNSPKALGLRKVMADGDTSKYPDVCKYCQKCEGRYTRDKPGIKF